MPALVYKCNPASYKLDVTVYSSCNIPIKYLGMHVLNKYQYSTKLFKFQHLFETHKQILLAGCIDSTWRDNYCRLKNVSKERHPNSNENACRPEKAGNGVSLYLTMQIFCDKPPNLTLGLRTNKSSI